MKSSSNKFKVFVTPNFLKEAQDLKKKYPKIKENFLQLKDSLSRDPITGNDNLGKDCYKVRMSIADKNSGQSSGARLIIEVKIIDKEVYVLSVYDKSYK